jgi:hypothetical protein
MTRALIRPSSAGQKMGLTLPLESLPHFSWNLGTVGGSFPPSTLIKSDGSREWGTHHQMTDPGTTVRIVVKLRELDTDARTVFEHDVPPPQDASEQRARLIEAVAQHKPEAEIRSFADHTASFLDSEHLVVAYFKEPREIGRALKELSRQHGQRELFAPASDEAA